jgi:hypothetical protein
MLSKCLRAGGTQALGGAPGQMDPPASVPEITTVHARHLVVPSVGSIVARAA